MANMTIGDHSRIDRGKGSRYREPATRRITGWRPRPSTLGILALFVALAGTALAPPPSRAAGVQRGSGAGTGGCDAGTMRGVYAINLTGTMLGLPLAVVGHVAFKREGRASGVLTEVWNGQPTRYTFDGAYSLGSDCRGELSYRAEQPLAHTRTFAFYPAAGGERASFVLAGAEAPGATASANGELFSNSSIVLSGGGERLSKRRMTCDTETMRGVYPFHATGATAAGGLFTFTFAGEIEFDGAGGVSIQSVGTMPHTVDHDVHYSGTYTVDSSCRGQARLSGEHFDVRDHHIADLYATARGTRGYAIFTKSWVEEFLGIGVDPMGINEELAHGNEQEFSYTFSGAAERR